MNKLIRALQLSVVIGGSTFAYCILAGFVLLREPIPLWAWLAAGILTLGLANSLFSFYRTVSSGGRWIASIAFFATWLPLCGTAAFYAASHIVTPSLHMPFNGYFWFLFLAFSAALLTLALCMSRRVALTTGS